MSNAPAAFDTSDTEIDALRELISNHIAQWGIHAHRAARELASAGAIIGGAANNTPLARVFSAANELLAALDALEASADNGASA